jgi:hypothetical protein
VRFAAAVGVDSHLPLASRDSLLVLLELLKLEHCAAPTAAALAFIVRTPREDAVCKAVGDSKVFQLVMRLVMLPDTPVVEHCTFVVQRLAHFGQCWDICLLSLVWREPMSANCWH